MAELIISTFDVDGVTAPALEVVKAAVNHAAKNRGTKQHSMTIEAFCGLAGLAVPTTDDFTTLLSSACRALIFVEAIDTEAPERDDLPYSSWPVFDEVAIDRSNFIFKVSNRTFDEKLLSSLQQLTVSEKRKKRKVVLFGQQKGRGSSTVSHWKPIVIG